MPHGRRKVPFSGKKKKEQMIAKRARKQHARIDDDEDDFQLQDSEATVTSRADKAINYEEEILAVNQQPGVNPRVNRYNLKFRKETPAEKQKRKALHNLPVELLSKTDLECASESFYPPGLSYPTRPPWKTTMSKDELDMSENRYFRLFCEKIDREFSHTQLSMYELNLETWRQLWRVTEMSDILLIIVDGRFPVSQFPPYLYEHLVEKENKSIILIMNKCDLLPPSVILAWERYFAQHYPKLIVVPFYSMEGRKGKRGLIKMAAESSLSLVDACQKLVDDSVDLSSWRQKIEEERGLANFDDDSSVEVLQTNIIQVQNTSPEVYQRYRDGILTIGTIGHPNVGKSSLINALMGKKVVSVSKTPGHTKHFQTIFLTKNIKLCDCPGLVFPSTVDMPLQVLLGSFPIAQVRDPIGVVQYIAARIDMPSILRLQLSEEDMCSSQWTSYLICFAWAEKRGYRTKSRGAPDVSRAANELLRFCLMGLKSLVVYQRPPGYTANRGRFQADPQIQRIQKIQGFQADEEETEQGKGAERVLNEQMEVDSEVEDGNSDEGDEDEESESADDSCPMTVQNKFNLLLDDD